MKINKKGWKGDICLFGYVTKEFFDGRWSVWHTGMNTIDVHRNSYLLRRYSPFDQSEKTIKKLITKEMAEIEKAHRDESYQYMTTGYFSIPIKIKRRR